MRTDARRAHGNVDFYADYYDKPWWWFRLRYDTQVKRKTVLWLLRSAGISRRQKRVLEIGFGSGEVLFSFDRSCKIAGAEIAQSAVTRAAVRARQLGFCRAEFALAQTNSLRFPDGSFDLVIASHVLEHVVEEELLLSEIHRVLSRTGAAVILVPINERYADPKHVRSYDESLLATSLTNAGLVPKVVVKNEFLYHLVDKFYSENYKERWGIAGTLLAGLFNVPAALIPFPLLRCIDGIATAVGLPPRQCGIVAFKTPIEISQNP
jgi:ubiquinone/menaquinone biosynthesis C-methylase UbiE